MPVLEPIVCSQCGAPLQVPPGVSFVTCNHCQAALAVKREASATYTERLDALEGRTSSMAEQLAEFRHREELALLEQAWAQERAELMIRLKDGRERIPDAAKAAGPRILAGILCLIVFLGSAVAMPGQAWFWILFCLVMLVLLWLSARREINLAEKYQAAEAHFVERRRALLKGPLTE